MLVIEPRFNRSSVSSLAWLAGNALVQQLQEATLAGACSAITAAAPALLTAADSASLPSVLWGYQQLLLSCKVGWLASSVFCSI